MKQTIKRLFGFASLAFVLAAGLFIASPAQATPTWTKTTHNGDTNCYNSTNATSATTLYIYCGSTYTPQLNTTFQAGLTAYGGIPDAAAYTLTQYLYTVWYFESFNDYCLSQLAAGDPTFTADCTAQYNHWVNTAGYTASPSVTGTLESESFIFEQEPYGVGSYPTTFANATVPHTVLHESGHAWDWARGNGTYPLSETNQVGTSTITYYAAIAGDYVALQTAPLGCGNNTSSAWNTDVHGYPGYFFCPVLGGDADPPNNFKQIFAEEFAMGSSGTKWYPAPGGSIPYQSSPPALDYEAVANIYSINEGLVCTNAWVWYYMVNNVAPTQAYMNTLDGTRCQYLNGTGFNHSSGG